ARAGGHRRPDEAHPRASRRRARRAPQGLVSRRRRGGHYGGDGAAWEAPPEERAAVERLLHRPHAPRTATRRPTPWVRPRAGYLAPADGLLTYQACRVCGDAWPCAHADRCAVDDEPWPCQTTTTNGDHTT